MKKKYTCIDLFAGCGGMSLGFELAGFTTIHAIEKDAWAAETYALNHKNTKVSVVDITTIHRPLEFINRKQFSVDGIIGGPPCQGFSLSGNRDPKDPRNSLFMDYMRFVRTIKPKFFVMENVPGILSAKTKKKEIVHQLILCEAEDAGYNVHIFKVNADKYGVPQSRHRVLFVGIRSDFPFAPSKLIPKEISKRFSIDDAIGDLPVLNAGEGREAQPYLCKPQNAFQKWCRNGSQSVKNHIAMKHTSRLIRRFEQIKYGQSVADVPDEYKQRQRGNASKISGKTYSQNNMRPFPNQPSPTIPASFQSNFVHPHFNRNYTAREGARLQSFPDTYIFCGKRTTMSWEKNLSQYQQIGNAVPPLLAKAVGMAIMNYFQNIKKIKPENNMACQTTLWD